MYAGFQLGRGRQEKDIGDRDSVDCRNERYRDSAADFFDVLEVLHHLDQPHDRANDSDGRRISAGGFENLGVRFGGLLCLE